MSRHADREYDKTCLKVFLYDGIHRDYAAHFFRWGFISSKIIKRGSRVLDIGCGVQVPLARMIANTEESKSMIPAHYVGVDYNSAPKDVFKSKWCDFYYSFNFPKKWKELHGPFDVITCLEVVEHMTPKNVKDLLHGACQLLADDGTFVLSTPVFNGKAARNHINEMDVRTLTIMLKTAGFTIEKRFGTFASWNDIKRAASPEHLAVATELQKYYSGAVVSCFLAPLYPDAARNNIWLCRKETTQDLL